MQRAKAASGASQQHKVAATASTGVSGEAISPDADPVSALPLVVMTFEEPPASASLDAWGRPPPLSAEQPGMRSKVALVQQLLARGYRVVLLPAPGQGQGQGGTRPGPARSLRLHALIHFEAALGSSAYARDLRVLTVRGPAGPGEGRVCHVMSRVCGVRGCVGGALLRVWWGPQGALRAADMAVCVGGQGVWNLGRGKRTLPARTPKTGNGTWVAGGRGGGVRGALRGGVGKPCRGRHDAVHQVRGRGGSSRCASERASALPRARHTGRYGDG